MKLNRIGLFASAVVLSSSLATYAQDIPNRAALTALLGGGGTTDDFETFSLGFGGQAYGPGLITSTSTFDGQGPGLVNAGASYSAPYGLFWEGNGYYDLNTQTLGDSAVSGPITITYTSPVQAFGFDMQNYVGYGDSGSVAVYGPGNTLLDLSSVDGGFFGWENLSGITSVVITANFDADNYIMIDNHTYGNVGSVPDSTSTMALLGFGLAGLGWCRRKIG